MAVGLHSELCGVASSTARELARYRFIAVMRERERERERERARERQTEILDR